MKLSLVVNGLLAVLLLGGCPNTGRPDPTVAANISASATSLAPGDLVMFDASTSTSKNGGALTYQWDFAGEATTNAVSATHQFNAPGLYTVTLTVTDETGATGTSTVDIRVRGAEPTARIVTDVTSGPATLVVQFDGTTSSAPDDEIRDFIWDFDDGNASTSSNPIHGFTTPGTYTVKLTVRTYGGVEGEAFVTIEVEASPTHSLQFDGMQVVLLALGGSQTLTDWTFEAWVEPTITGGTVVSTLDGGLMLQVLPSSNKLRYQAGAAGYEASATSLANAWHHVALSNQASGRTVLYLDGTRLIDAPAAGQVVADQLNLGLAFSGKIAEVRMWTEARSAAEITLNLNRRLLSPSAESNLLGYWRIDEDGSAQLLENLGTAGYPGVLGSSLGVDVHDPAWSTDGPEL
jgi:PKD repeat protein